MKKIFTSLLLFITVFLTSGAGYMGTLPDVEAEFSYLRKEHSAKSSPQYTVEELDKKTEKELKPIPRDDNNYVDIIIKRDKSTKYLNDVNSVIIILEKLRQCLNTDGNIQRFNAIVSNFIDNVYYIQEEYKDKPESNYMSYSRLILLSSEARETANYWTQGKLSEPYIPYNSTSNIYKKEDLERKKQQLLNDVNDMIFVLKNLE